MSFHLFFFFLQKIVNKRKAFQLIIVLFINAFNYPNLILTEALGICVSCLLLILVSIFFFTILFSTKKKKRFIPPDGEFELMKYRTSSNVKIPFKMFHNYKELSKSRLDIKITVNANFARDGKLFNNKINNHHNK